MRRCLALAHNLKTNGHNIIFISRSDEGNLSEAISSQGFKIHLFAKKNRVLHANCNTKDKNSVHVLQIFAGFVTLIKLLNY